MRDWRVRQLYGFGAGQLRLAPHPAGLISQPVSTREAFAGLAGELGSRSRSEQVRSACKAAMALGLGIVLFVVLGSENLEAPEEAADLEFVWMEVPEPPVALVEPVVASQPIPIVAEVVPEPEIAVPAAPVEIARVRPEVLPVALPEVVEVAQPEPPRMIPTPVPVRSRPDVHIEELASLPTPTPPSRPSRTAREKPVSVAKTPVRVSPVAQHSMPRPPRTTPTRADASRPTLASSAPARVPVTVAFTAPVEQAATGPSRSGLSARSAVFHPQSMRRSVAPAALLGAAGGPGVPAQKVALAVSRGSTRTVRSDSLAHASVRSEPDASLEGVPLSALEACMTDSEEDRLKLGVLERVSQPTECVSPAGRYRFVETKNLNAFLMWIERSPRRAPTDRCGELRLAIDCLDTEPMYGGST